ncbi:hypothetical protein KBD69_00115 [Candidatus Woesebacteria bacterium]|nr:hypothetical protein [Candidatus Woesebacteria bacterium]
MKIIGGEVHASEEEVLGSALFEKEVSLTLGLNPHEISMQHRATVAVMLLQELPKETIYALSSITLVAAREYLSGLNDALSTIKHGLDQGQIEVFHIIAPMVNKIPTRLKKNSPLLPRKN